MSDKEKTREELLEERQRQIDELTSESGGVIQEVGIGKGLSDGDLKKPNKK